ncbi:efflux RND transporter permease subunit [Gemmatimonadota bacterium]
MKPIFRFFAERHILANLLTIMVILLGLNTLLTIKRDIYPKVDFGQLTIITRYPGASPEDVEFNVTNKIERELKSVIGLDNVSSISMENVSVINAIIDIDAGDQEKVKSEIREAVARVTDFPPEVTESPRIVELYSTMFAVIEVGLSGEIPYRDLREHARLFEKKLKEVPGVADLDRVGWRAREIRVEVSPDEIADFQIPIREIIAAIQGRNIRGTAGSFESYTSERDLVTLAQFRDPREVGNVIVRSSFEGPLVRISDLAIVRDDFEDERVLSRMNGKAAISFRVTINESADVMRTCDAVKELIERERGNLPEEVEILYVNDLSRIVRSSFEVLLNNGLIGLLLVIIILPIFLTFRTAFWVAMGIPISLLGAIFLLPLFGAYLDTVLFTGLILVIGIIVDDAIIVAENVSSWRERGHPPLEAAVEGLHEVFRPVVTTVLTTFLVFAPMFFLPGLFGKYLIVIPLAISLALFVSLAESLELNPGDWNPMFGLGQVLLWNRRYDEAEVFLEKAISILPEVGDPYRELALLQLLRNGDRQESARVLNRAPVSVLREIADVGAPRQFILLRNVPDVLEPYVEDLDWMRWAELQLGKGNWDEAMAAYRSFIEDQEQAAGDPDRDFDSEVVANAALFNAAAGDVDRTYHWARLAMDTKDSWNSGPHSGWRTVERLARAFLWVGEWEPALLWIEHLLSRPAPISVQLLEIDPAFKPFIADPRFAALLEKYR